MGNCGGSKGNAKVLSVETSKPTNLDLLLAKNIPLEYIQSNDQSEGKGTLLENNSRGGSMTELPSENDVNQAINQGTKKGTRQKEKIFGSREHRRRND